MDNHICPSCGNDFTGNFCNNCGEEVLHPEQRRMRFYMHRIFNALTFADTKMLRTVWSIIRFPGTISKDFSKGKRVVHSSPISLFFIANLIYFLFPFLETFNTSLQVQTQMMPYSNFANTLVQNRIEKRDTDIDSYTQKFNLASTANAKLLLILMVLFIAFGLAIICRRREMLMGDHFIFSLEINIYNLLVNTILLAIIIFPVILLFRAFGINLQEYLNDNLFTVIILISLTTYLYAGIRRFYRFGRMQSIFRVIALLVWIGLSLQAYRFMLFIVTYVLT